MNKIPVVILRSNDISFLGLLRSLSENEDIDVIPVIFSWNDDKWFCEESKYFKNFKVIHNPASHEKEAVKDLILIGREIKKKYGKRALTFCSSDVNLILLHKYENKLSEFFTISGDSEFKSYRSNLSNKGNFFTNIQKSFYENVPKFRYIETKNDLKKLDKWEHFPCVIKPAIKDLSQSFYKINDRKKAIYCKSKEALKENLLKLLNSNYKLLVQEYICFDKYDDEIPTYTFFDKFHELKVYANGIKKIIYPEHYGTAIILEISFHKELINICKDLAKFLNWSGPLMIEFIRDKKDKNFKIIEINPRPWLFHDFYRKKGLPFIPMSVEEYINKKYDQKETIFPSKKVIGHVNQDILSLADFFFDKNNNELTNIKKTKLFTDFIFSLPKEKINFAHFDANDPLPMMKALYHIEQKYRIDVREINKLIF